MHKPCQNIKPRTGVAITWITEAVLIIYILIKLTLVFFTNPDTYLAIKPISFSWCLQSSISFHVMPAGSHCGTISEAQSLPQSKGLLIGEERNGLTVR